MSHRQTDARKMMSICLPTYPGNTIKMGIRCIWLLFLSEILFLDFTYWYILNIISVWNKLLSTNCVDIVMLPLDFPEYSTGGLHLILLPINLTPPSPWFYIPTYSRKELLKTFCLQLSYVETMYYYIHSLKKTGHTTLSKQYQPDTFTKWITA